jgi:hypothetical protein
MTNYVSPSSENEKGRKIPLGRPKWRGKENIKKDLNGIGCQGELRI